MHIKPCARCCLRQTCEIRAAKVKGVCGLKLTSIKFVCDIPQKMFRPGMRVKATLLTGREEFEADATVMAWKDDKVLVCVDEEFQSDLVQVYCYEGVDYEQPEGTIKKSVVKIWPDRLKLTGETVPICRDCRKPMHVTIPGWKCRKEGEDQPCVAGDPEAWWKEQIAKWDAEAQSATEEYSAL